MPRKTLARVEAGLAGEPEKLPVERREQRLALPAEACRGRTALGIREEKSAPEADFPSPGHNRENPLQTSRGLEETSRGLLQTLRGLERERRLHGAVSGLERQREISLRIFRLLCLPPLAAALDEGP